MPLSCQSPWEDDPILQAFHARQCVKKIQAAFQQKTSRSPLLQRKPHQHVAFLPRSKIRTGRVLGEGAFCQVLEVTGIVRSEEQASSSSSSSQSYLLLDKLQTKAQQGQLVLKQLKPQGVDDFVGAAVDLATEAALLLRLSHENLVGLHALPPNFLQAFGGNTTNNTTTNTHTTTTPASDTFYLLLDRVDTDLLDQVQRWSKSRKSAVPTAAQRLDYAQQLARVLAYLHAQGIVYRDLKPDNVGLCQPSGQIQLFDLGLARQLPSKQLPLYQDKDDDDNDDSDNSDKKSEKAHKAATEASSSSATTTTTTSTASTFFSYPLSPIRRRRGLHNKHNNTNDVSSTPPTPSYRMSQAGTPRYMAPEVGRGATYNTQADVYGWAILVWELLALKPAFSGYTTKQLWDKVLVGHERPSLRQLSGSAADLHNLLAAAWHADPHQRPDMDAVLAELAPIVMATQQQNGNSPPRSPLRFLRKRTVPRLTASCA